MSKSNPKHLIAFWLLGNFSKSGQFPYMILPATAYDQRSRSARGYAQGRFIGPNRYMVKRNTVFPYQSPEAFSGGVLFVNTSTADNKAQDLKLFGSVKPGYGLGLRILADKKTRTNLAIDYAFGNKSSGFYLAASETF